jgi:hypothetical protein
LLTAGPFAADAPSRPNRDGLARQRCERDQQQRRSQRDEVLVDERHREVREHQHGRPRPDVTTEREQHDERQLSEVEQVRTEVVEVERNSRRGPDSSGDRRHLRVVLGEEPGDHVHRELTGQRDGPR